MFVNYECFYTRISKSNPDEKTMNFTSKHQSVIALLSLALLMVAGCLDNPIDTVLQIQWNQQGSNNDNPVANSLFRQWSSKTNTTAVTLDLMRPLTTTK